MSGKSKHGKRKYYSCSVVHCTNTTTNSDLTFFSLPADIQRRNLWLQQIQREDLVDRFSTHYRVCEAHFESTAVLISNFRKVLKKTACPTNVEPIPTRRYCVETTQTSTQEDAQNTTRKRKNEDFSCLSAKKQKTIKTNREIETLIRLSEKHLPKNSFEIVLEQIKLNLQCEINRNSIEYKMFCLNLFHSSPKVYQLIHNMLSLPSKAALKRTYIPVSTEINSGLIQVLKTTLKQMSSVHTNCSLVLSSMKIKPNLVYNIKHDKIYGFHEVEGVQSPQPARYALVAMLRGITNTYEQPVGYALLAENKCYQSVTDWIHNLLQKLFEIGLNVRCLVSDIESKFLSGIRELTSKQIPYYFLEDNKIYMIYEPSSLMKSARDTLLYHNIHFNKLIAKWDHIVQFYEKDKTKQLRLASKLTESHVKPNELDQLKTKLAVDVFSGEVATGLSTYTDFGAFEGSAYGTIELIQVFVKFRNILNSSPFCGNTKYYKVFSDEQNQISLVEDMLKFFSSLRVFNEHGEDKTSTSPFIEGCQVTLKSLSLMIEDLKLDGCSGIFTLNEDCLENLFNRLPSKCCYSGEVTGWQLVSVLRKIFYIKTLLRPSIRKYKDILDIFKETNRLHCYLSSAAAEQDAPILTINERPVDVPEIKEEPPDVSTVEQGTEYTPTVMVKIEPVDEDVEAELPPTSTPTPKIPIAQYKVELPRGHSPSYMSAHLLQQCVAQHRDCTQLWGKQESGVMSSVILPLEEFMGFVSSLEHSFRTFFSSDTIKGPIKKAFMKYIENISFALPCSCFPIDYCKHIYFGVRLHNALKHNNNAMLRCEDIQTYKFSV